MDTQVTTHRRLLLPTAQAVVVQTWQADCLRTLRDAPVQISHVSQAET